MIKLFVLSKNDHPRFKGAGMVLTSSWALILVLAGCIPVSETSAIKAGSEFRVVIPFSDFVELSTGNDGKSTTAKILKRMRCDPGLITCSGVAVKFPSGRLSKVYFSNASGRIWGMSVNPDKENCEPADQWKEKAKLIFLPNLHGRGVEYASRREKSPSITMQVSQGCLTSFSISDLE
mgnify:CR=1 FL=1